MVSKEMAEGDLSLQVPASCRPGESGKTKRDFTEIVEEYVEGIYRLREGLGRATTGELADYMCVSPGSATSMVRKLDHLGLVKYTPYKSVELTADGEKLAKVLTRTHRVLKRFLVDMVGLPWNDVHELACKLEHYMSADVIDRMYERLDRPKTCPHGNPINPDEEDGSVRLADTAVGDKLRMVKVTNERYEFLKFLEEVGLLPGKEFEFVGATEIDGLLHLGVGGKRVTVGREVARHVGVQKTA